MSLQGGVWGSTLPPSPVCSRTVRTTIDRSILEEWEEKTIELRGEERRGREDGAVVDL